jgi:hypothetical protein
MNIELTEFTFHYKLNKLLKLNINPISFQQTKLNIYYYNLYYYFEYFFQFVLISRQRRENILNQYISSYYIPSIDDLFSPFFDSNTHYSFIHIGNTYNQLKKIIYNNEGIYNPILTKLLKNLY